ncbi:MAG: transposase [Proteobacteria bacterium]|nr:transposase [Pseudomonadota bacterium]
MGRHQGLAAFADEMSAYRYLEGVLWSGKRICPNCQTPHSGSLNGASARPGEFRCVGCRGTFSIRRSTVLERSRVPLHKWLQAVYLTDGGALPISALHLAFIVGVSRTTASGMLRKMRHAARRRNGEANRSLEAMRQSLSSVD